MKNKNSLTIFDVRRQKKKRFIIWTLVIVIIMTTCFGQAPLVSEADVDDKPEDYTYFQCIVDEMTKDKDRKFTILEIVPDTSCSEFLFYGADKSIRDKLDWINENEQDTTIRRWFGTIGGWDGAVMAQSQYQLNADGFSNFKFTFNISRLTGKKYVEVENMFLNYVLTDYVDFMEDRLVINTKAANEVTVEDVQNADFVYVSTKCHDNNTYTTNQFFNGYMSDGEGGYQPVEASQITKYTRNADGSFTEVAVNSSGNAPTYMDYEFVENGSEKDELLRSIDGRITGANPEYLTYPSADGRGYYISRDLSWAAAEAIMNATLEGKTFKNGQIRMMPVVFDASTIGTAGNNVKRMEAVVRSTITDVPTDADKIISDKDGNTYTGYAIVKNMISTVYPVYNEYGAKTAVMHSQYYSDHLADNNDADGKAIIVDGKDSGENAQQVSEKDGRYVTSSEWEGYLAYLCQDIQYGRAGNIKAKLDAEGIFINAVKTGAEESYTNSSGEKVYTSASTNFLIDNQAFTSRQDYLNPHYYAFRGTANLIPQNYDTKLWGVSNAPDLLGKDNGNYTVIDILKYLLGIRDGKIKVNPDPDVFGGLYLKVLEIEPASVFKFDTQEKIETLAAAMGIAKENLVTADSTGVTRNMDGSYTVPDGKYMIEVDCYTPNGVNGLNTEFIGAYDIIYIGDEKGNLNTDGSGDTVYRDSSLNGCLYTAYGDTTTVKSELMGFLSGDFAGTYRDGGVTYRYLKNGGTTARLSGNDLTEFKTEQIKKYAAAGNIVLVGDLLYDGKYTYATSNMRDLLGTITETPAYRGNVFKYSQAIKVIYAYNNQNPVFEKVDVTNSISASEVSPSLTYSDEEGIVNNVIRTGGAETKLTYHVKMGNLQEDKNYRMKIILDKNGDGIFSETETLDEANEIYHNHVYTGAELEDMNITIELNDKFSGLFIWKIIIQEEDTEKVIKSETTGSVAVNSRQRDVEVLQIVPGSLQPGKTKVYDITLLMAGQNDDGSYVTADNIRNAENIKGVYHTTSGLYEMTKEQVNSNRDITDFEKLLWQTYQAIGYKVNITAMTTDKFNEEYGNINDYDMVVLGFADCFGYSDVNESAAQAITDYINTGKALLFSHDTVSFTSLSAKEYLVWKNSAWSYAGDYWSPNISTRFRNLVGMNRYGVSVNDAENGNEYVPESSAGTKISEIQGISNFTLMRFSSGYKYPYNPSKAVSSSSMNTTKVDKLNTGQVTQYPFRIDESISVAKTHAQYYQLDMELPRDAEGNAQEEDKVMVWYTLAAEDGTNNYFSDTASDAINNYYIYSKANVTYTGAGHSKMLDSDGKATSISELKLFVNTIVKALAAGNFAPEVEVRNAQKSTGKYNIYINELAAEEDYKIVFCATDADLYEGRGRFKAADVVWTDDDGNDHVLIDYGNTLVSGIEQTIYIKDLQSVLSGDLYSKLITEIQNGTADFTITAEDARGAKGTANVGFTLRQLFWLD